MRLDMSQNMRLLQTMKLAPRMIQSMEILQLPVMALEERIREELEDNVTLELGTSMTETPSTDLETDGDYSSVSLSETDAPATEGPSEQEMAAYEQLAEEWSENYIPNHQPSRLTGIELSDKKHDAMQNMADRPRSLEDHLVEQLTFFDEEAIVIEFAKFLIANLDQRGFLNGPLNDIRINFAQYMTDDQAERALWIVQQLDPPGVGARDLRECLLLQLEDADPANFKHLDVLRTLVANHLEDIEHNRLPVIERKSGYSLEIIHAAIEELRFLDLNPGAAFTPTHVQYVVPDVIIEMGQDGNYEIRMNEENTPNVRIGKHYLDMLREKQGDPKALEYVKKKIMAAKWLLESIEQRRNTLEKVTRAIIDHQRAFLENGPDSIEPLKMQQIADRVGVHVTTVSRAVDDKWVQTPRGIFPLKRFFGGGTVTSSGEEVAWDTIKRKLTDVINQEDKTNPYSDDELVKKLAENGYPLARRTVTKYRKMLGIPSSRQRKQHV